VRCDSFLLLSLFFFSPFSLFLNNTIRLVFGTRREANGKRFNEFFILFMVLKPLPVLLLIWRLSSVNGVDERPHLSNTFLLGLLFGVLGDVCLLMTHKKPWFLAGLVSFLIGHVLYIYGFFVNCESSFAVPLELALPLSFVSIAYGKWIIGRVAARDSQLTKPITAYFIVIISMLFVALNYNYNLQVHGRWHATIGAILFVISDSFIALATFVTNFPLSDILILATYYPAQAFIAGQIADDLN
jgi:uncharacterized membrane protein YhhN